MDLPQTTRLSTKKSLFPVQRVAVNVASRAAAIFFFFSIFIFGLVGKYFPLLGKKKKNGKLEKKVSSRPFFRHPAGPPETELFLDWPQYNSSTHRVTT